MSDPRAVTREGALDLLSKVWTGRTIKTRNRRERVIMSKRAEVGEGESFPGCVRMSDEEIIKELTEALSDITTTLELVDKLRERVRVLVKEGFNLARIMVSGLGLF